MYTGIKLHIQCLQTCLFVTFCAKFKD